MISPFPPLCMGIMARICSYIANILKMKALGREADQRDEKTLHSGITAWQY